MVRNLSVAVAVSMLAFSTVHVPPSGAADFTLTRSEGSATATADFFGTSFPPQSDQETFGPFGGVAVAEVGAFGRTRAAQTGSGLNAVTAGGRLGDIPAFSLRAQTEIDMGVENTGTSRESLIFDYLINGGELRLFDPRGSFDGLEATVAASIFVLSPGASGFVWDWGVTLRGDGGVVTSAVHGFAPIFPFVDPLGLGQPDISAITVTGGEAVLSIAPFTAVIDLGELGPGATSIISYTMFGAVSGPGLNATGGEATLGDPFNLTGDPGSTISIRGLADPTAPVPAPSTVTLIVLGVMAVLAGPLRRIRRIRTSMGSYVSRSR